MPLGHNQRGVHDLVRSSSAQGIICSARQNNGPKVHRAPPGRFGVGRECSAMEHPLDNPVWQPLIGPHQRFALGAGQGLARHYDREVAPFSAIAEPTSAAYADLAVDLPAGTVARLFRPRAELLPAGWEEVTTYRL